MRHMPQPSLPCTPRVCEAMGVLSLLGSRGQDHACGMLAGMLQPEARGLDSTEAEPPTPPRAHESPHPALALIPTQSLLLHAEKVGKYNF